MRISNRAGQTLIVGILILGVLLSLGMVFAGIVSRNITQTGRSQRRSKAGDLADAGIRLAHSQMLYGQTGADWRPAPTTFAVDAQGFTRDPDALYMRPGSGLFLPGRDGLPSAFVDRGGPDGLGPFSRVDFDKGRALIRVLYIPGDFDLFNAPRTGVVRDPAKARGFIRIESIGRTGRADVNDPTLNAKAHKVGNYTGGFAEFRSELGALKAESARLVDTKKLIGFVSIGIIEHARYVTNKFNVSRPIQIGSPTAAVGGGVKDGLGITYEGQDVVVPTLFGMGQDSSTGQPQSQGGSIYINGNLEVNGTITSVLNPQLGDSIEVAGAIAPANNNAQINLDVVGAGGAITRTTVGSGALRSFSNGYSTFGGLLRDGIFDTDTNGFVRGVTKKAPPTIMGEDPATHTNRYLTITRDSGVIVNNRNSGRFGHGQGLYCDESDRGTAGNEVDREDSGEGRISLVRDWLNPNNPDSVAWQGPFYVPKAAYVRLMRDGVEIIRDIRSDNPDQRFWRRPDGTLTSESSCRWRFQQIGGQIWTINSISEPDIIDTPGLSNLTFQQRGRVFNGVMYFEGDVRVRGIIPVDTQITLVSMGSIYLDGSITKSPYNGDARSSLPSKSMIMLMAKEYCVVNTTMFVGPEPGEPLLKKTADPQPNTPNPIELNLDQKSVRLDSEFLLNPVDPATGFLSGYPNVWEPYANHYISVDGSPITPTLLIAHAADDNGPSFMSLQVKPLSQSNTVWPEANYMFASNGTFNPSMQNYYGTPRVPVYGLANPATNAFPRFEIIGMEIGGPGYTNDDSFMSPTAAVTWGNFRLALNEATRLTINLVTEMGRDAAKNYALARVGINPHDVRIEAAMYAEEGSFFVIPGPGFNMNAEDTREAFQADVTALGSANAAQVRRFENFGSMPAAPFYGEPLNTRIVIVGAVSENLPADLGQQAEWQKKWGWMPRTIGATGQFAPRQHVPSGWGNIQGNNATDPRYLPNLIITYDPMLAFGSAEDSTAIRRSADGRWILPPMPRLPVSPTLAYFGEENP